jgi:hypothetical protein
MSRLPKYDCPGFPEENSPVEMPAETEIRKAENTASDNGYAIRALLRTTRKVFRGHGRWPREPPRQAGLYMAGIFIKEKKG